MLCLYFTAVFPGFTKNANSDSLHRYLSLEVALQSSMKTSKCMQNNMSGMEECTDLSSVHSDRLLRGAKRVVSPNLYVPYNTSPAAADWHYIPNVMHLKIL